VNWLRLVALALILSAPQLALAEPTPPRKVHVGLFVLDVQHINDLERSAEVDFVIVVSWHDPSLVGKYDKPTVVPPGAIWNPDVGVFNNRNLRTQRSDDLTVTPEGQVSRTQRYLGTIGTRFDLGQFPLDRHDLLFDLASSKAGEVQLVLQPELTGQSEEFSLTGWTFKQGQGSEIEHSLLHLRLPGIRYSLPIQRITSYYVWSVILPLALVVVMSITSLWIRPNFVAPRIGVAATAMLTVITYRFALAQQVPAFDYLTRLDLFLLGATGLVLGTLVVAVLSTRWHASETPERAERLDRVCRAAFPTLFLVATAITLLVG
jgi:gamma-aminobutyric acid receptor subunit beta